MTFTDAIVQQSSSTGSITFTVGLSDINVSSDTIELFDKNYNYVEGDNYVNAISEQFTVNDVDAYSIKYNAITILKDNVSQIENNLLKFVATNIEEIPIETSTQFIVGI